MAAVRQMKVSSSFRPTYITSARPPSSFKKRGNKKRGKLSVELAACWEPAQWNDLDDTDLERGRV